MLHWSCSRIGPQWMRICRLGAFLCKIRFSCFSCLALGLGEIVFECPFQMSLILSQLKCYLDILLGLPYLLRIIFFMISPLARYDFVCDLSAVNSTKGPGR